MNSSLATKRDTFVFCQITSKSISPESCSRSQGQSTCFGCASPARRCEKCQKNYVAVAATGTCSSCTRELIELEKGPQQIKVLRVQCQLVKKSISTAVCVSTQGQDGCRGCTAASRLCESCGIRHVMYPRYGTCFTCAVTEFGDDWDASLLDSPVTHPYLQIVPRDSTADEDGPTIRSIAEDFRRVSLNQINDADDDVSVREIYDEEELLELGASMIDEGLIGPVVLESTGADSYRVWVGGRRVSAARRKGVSSIPALIVHESQDVLTRLIVMLAENLHRVNLDPFEEGKIFIRLIRDHKLDIADIALKIKKSNPYVSDRVQLHSLPKEIQALIATGKLATRYASVMARLPSDELIIQFAHEQIAHGYSVDELRHKVTQFTGKRGNKSRWKKGDMTARKFLAGIQTFDRWIARAMPQIDIDKCSDDQLSEIAIALLHIEHMLPQYRKKFERQK